MAGLCEGGNELPGSLKASRSRKQGISTEVMRMKQCDKKEGRQERSRDNLIDIQEYSRKRSDIDRISLAL
ncbi:hypothetical protein ANN_15525 [Periplaneta americana]|uniref:Uncharacterized protein n=1 Tax=Periplaneta americana TaxID=6978 RepID=A0ABQ8SHU4_PERAM|nr:hypothetical protein ANN_15525 [Periplaneta americana]